MRTLIVGGVAGGMSAATRLRRLDESAEIVVFERGAYVSFANCGLPYYVGGVIEDRADLLPQSPESLAARFELDVRVRHDVIAIDRRAKTITVRDLQSGSTSTEAYDTLILAGGATATPGAVTASVPTHTLRTIDDVDAIAAILTEAGDQPRAVVIGAGFIGLEAVENLVARGVQVTLVQRGSQILAPLDPEMVAPVLDVLTSNGVDVRTGTTVVSSAAGPSDPATPHRTRPSRGTVTLSDGSVLPVDLVIEASGVRPDTALAESAGLTIGQAGGIAVDGWQRSNDPFIFAVGDGVEKTDAIDARATLVTMAGLANRHGRSAADAIAAHATESRLPAAPALGTAIIGVLGLTVAMVGWSETKLRAAGRGHRVIHTHPMSHASYYPGAEQLAIKLLVDCVTDLILGAQIIGREGVDKRIDVLATAMTGGITASALTRLELAYAPQFGSAKDPINLAGYVAENLMSGTTRSIQWHELDAAVEGGAVVIDVRGPEEFEAGSIPGAINIPLDELRVRRAEVPDAPLIVHCRVGQRGHTASRLLTQLGHEVQNLDGGWLTWAAGMSTAATTATPATRATTRSPAR